MVPIAINLEKQKLSRNKTIQGREDYDGETQNFHYKCCRSEMHQGGPEAITG